MKADASRSAIPKADAGGRQVLDGFECPWRNNTKLSTGAHQALDAVTRRAFDLSRMFRAGAQVQTLEAGAQTEENSFRSLTPAKTVEELSAKEPEHEQVWCFLAMSGWLPIPIINPLRER